MRKSILVCGLLGSLLGVNDANAQSKEWHSCIDGTKTNVEWAQCGEAEIDREEARLNSAWKQAFACFEGAEMAASKQAFLDEQRLWVKWKDASCNFYYADQAFGREGQVLDYPACRAAVIVQRTQFLQRFGKDCR